MLHMLLQLPFGDPQFKLSISRSYLTTEQPLPPFTPQISQETGVSKNLF